MLDAEKVDAINRTMPKVKFALIGTVVGILLGVAGTVFVQSYNPPDEPASVAPTAVFERFVEQSELTTVSQNYCIVDKYSDVATFFDLFDLPWTSNSVWYRYAGTLKAGVNLKSAEMTSDGTLIHVTLDQPYITSNTPDMEISGILEENNNILNPIHVEDVDEIHRECIRISEEEAVAGGLLEEARVQAENEVTVLFESALGDDYTVDFTWRGAQ